MDEYGNVKTEQFKNDHLSLAMSVFPPRPVSGTANPFQNAAMPSAYGFNMDSALGHTSSLYNPPSSHLPNTAKIGSRPPDADTRQMNHSFTKPPSVIYPNFAPLNTCNIVTTNGFFSLNASSDMSKHSCDEVLNLPQTFHSDPSISAQMMLPKTQFHEPITAALTWHYPQESMSSYVHNLNSASQDIQMAEIKKHARNNKSQMKSSSDPVSVNNVTTNLIDCSSPLNNDTVINDTANSSVGDAAVSNDTLSSTYNHNSRNVYKCGFCELKVSSNEALQCHLNTHTNSFSYCCSVCGAAFVEGSQLVKHVQQSHVVKLPYACGLCTSTFHQNEELKQHMESHSDHVSININNIPPDSLDVTDVKKPTLKDNMKEDESESDEDIGDEVGVESSDQSSFHLNPNSSTIIISKDTNFTLRKGPSKILMDDIDLNSVCTVIVEPSSAGGIRKKHLFRCNYCEKVCKDKGSLVSHARTHTKGRPYECNVCFAKFKQYAHLSDHIMTKHTKERPFVCDRCAKTFNRKSHLQDHIRLRHTEDKLYHCPDCSAVFQKRTEFSDHKRTHGKRPKYQCNMCPRQFRNVTDYERHIRSHTKEKRYECEVCHLTFGLLANAKKHMIKHNEERPFKCEICPKAYHFEHDFKRHKLTHLKKKPFPCPDCYKSFKNALLLKKHAKDTHMKSEEDPSKKPFKCMTCRKRFRIQWDLDRHRKIHAKKKPFPCMYCYKSYGSEAMLTKHTKVHEGQNLPAYDHSKDIIEESDVDSSRRKCGRKPGFKVESHSQDCREEREDNEKPKRRGRPPKHKIESDTDRVSAVKLRERLSRKKIELENDRSSAPSIKITFKCSKLRRRKFPCPECSKAFMSKAMLERHSRVHDNEDQSGSDDESLSSRESTNEADDVVLPSNENANDASSLKESADHTNYQFAGDSARYDETDDERSKDEDTTRDDDGDNIWDQSTVSEGDESSSTEEQEITNTTSKSKQKRSIFSHHR